MAGANGFTVFLVDDEQDVLDTLTDLLDGAGYQSKPYVDARHFLKEHDASAHGCAVLDFSMPRLNGLDVQKELLKKGIERPVIFLSGQDNVAASVQAIKDGAIDFLQKPVDLDALLAAIKIAEQQDRHRLQTLAERDAIYKRMATLTSREREIANLVAKGLPNKNIAAELGVTLRTIKEYRSRACQKLGVRNVPELVRLLRKVS